MTLRLAFALVASATTLVLVACGSEEPAQFANTSTSATSSSAGGAGGAGGASSSASGQGGVGGETPAATTTTSSATTGAGGMGGAASSSGAGGAGGAPVCASPGDPCSDCMFAQCNGTFCDCSASPGCSAIVACVAGCAPGDSACTQACIDAQPTGVAEIVLVGDCTSTTCAASCGNPAPVDPCQVCLASHCETELETCLADAECVALIACVSLCAPGDQACLQTCGLQHLSGLAAGQALGNCSTASCSGICG